MTLAILREFGTIGDVSVNYITMTDDSLPLNEQATATEDYEMISNNISDEQTFSSINITILHDDIPGNQITSVELFDSEGANCRHVDADRQNIIQYSNSRGILNLVETGTIY